MKTPDAPGPERHVSDAPARALADHIAHLIRASAPGRPFAIAFSGGSTPVPLFRTLSGLTDLPWERVHVFLVDERFVPLDAEESNWRQLREALLDHVGVPECNQYPVPTHLGTAEEAAAAYEATLRSALGPTPAWDVAVMGMGDDGHTASLFPGDDFLDTDRLVAHTQAPPTSPVRDRITAALPFLNRARHVLFLVTGAGKRDLVRRVFDDPEACPDVPAACVRGQEGSRWYLDPAAGE